MDDATDDRRHRWRPRNRKLVAGSLLLALLAGTALIAPLLAPFDPLAQDLHATLLGPSTAHPLGTDALGRDVLSRLLFGARLSLAIGAIATAASLLLGTGIGMLAGYGGPLVDEVVSRAIDVFLAFPGLLLAIALAAVLGPSARNVVVALAVMGWTTYARLVRAEVRAKVAEESVRAAEALGARPWRIALHHLLPAVARSLSVQAAFGASAAIVAEASLSFLGLGPPPPTPSWGAMLAEGRALLLVAPHLAIAPAAALAATVLAIQWIADALATGNARRGAR
ncbi:MAG: Glutathione transport system permease protein GsiD [Pseudomonadota bacterium]|jgi:peptide/nickel transport system permease protein